VADEATADGPARRRTSWNLKSIVEDVAGRPIGELQDPDRPVHPYFRGKSPASEPVADPPPVGYDPVLDVYPPLIGSAGRTYFGSAHEHHSETLDRHRPLTDRQGQPIHPPGPSHRPERIYLHYLLLHLDRLSLSALRYLRLAVEEELAHREPRPAERDAPPLPKEDPVPAPHP